MEYAGRKALDDAMIDKINVNENDEGCLLTVAQMVSLLVYLDRADKKQSLPASVQRIAEMMQQAMETVCRENNKMNADHIGIYRAHFG